MTFIKQILEIGSQNNSIETTEGNNFSGEFDIDNLYGTLNFKLPYKKPAIGELVDITQLKKYDTVKLYYGTLSENKEDIKPADLDLVFDGFIKKIKLSKNKDSYNYEILAHGTLGLTEERTMELSLFEGDLVANVVRALKFSGLTNIIPNEKIRLIDTDVGSLIVKVSGGKNAKEVLSEIRKKYGVIIHQSGDGFVNIVTPFFLRENVWLGNTSIDTYEFRLGDNMFELDYGDLTSHINSVVVYGYPPFIGVAIDPIGLALNNNNYNYLTFENRDLNGDEECQKVARNKLLEIAKNNFITFKTLFDARFRIGQALKIFDEDRYNGNVFVIKSFSFTISKGDVSCNITAYSHGITDLPEDLTIGTGINAITDIDLIGDQKKVLDSIGLERGVSDL